MLTLAYHDSYTKLVNQVGGLAGIASTTAVQQAVTMAEPGHLFEGPLLKSKVVRELAAGAMLYPTGQKEGEWWEVTDELGDKGWVSSHLITLAK